MTLQHNEFVYIKYDYSIQIYIFIFSIRILVFFSNFYYLCICKNCH